MKESKKAWAFLAPSFIGVTCIVLIPFADVIKRSFFEAMSGKFAGVQNYITVFHNQAFLLAAKNTVKFIVVCVPILLVSSLFLSLMIYSVKKIRELLKASFLIPMAIPVSSAVFLWKVIFHQNGLLNGVLAHFGSEGYDWVGTKAFGVLVFSYIWKNIGYDMVLWMAGLNEIPISYYEAAGVDGANGWQKFWYITFPSLFPMAFIITVLSILNTFKVFREAYLIAGAYPQDENIYMLQHLFNNWFIALDIHKMCAGAVLVAAVILVVIMILQLVDRRAGEEV